MILVCIHCLPLYQKHDDIKYNNKKRHPKEHTKGLAKAPPRSLCQQPSNQETQKNPLESQVHPMGKSRQKGEKTTPGSRENFVKVFGKLSLNYKW